MTAATACRTVSLISARWQNFLPERYFWGILRRQPLPAKRYKIQFHKAQGDVLRFFHRSEEDIGRRGGRRRDGAQKNVESGGTAELGHDVKEFSVYFGTDNYALPGKTVFQYRMLGFNDS